MLRLSLKGMLTILAILIVITSVGIWIYRAESQKSAVERIYRNGGFVRYDYQFRKDLTLSKRSSPKRVPVFLFHWLGPDYFANVWEVDFQDHQDSPFESIDAEIIAELGKTTILRLGRGPIKNYDQLGKLKNLRVLEIPNSVGPFARTIKFEAINQNLKNLEFLKVLRRLERVKLPQLLSTYPLAYLKNNKSLKHIYIGDEFDYYGKRIESINRSFSSDRISRSTEPFGSEDEEFEIIRNSTKGKKDLIVSVEDQADALDSFNELESFHYVEKALGGHFDELAIGFRYLTKLRSLHLETDDPIDLSNFSNSTEMTSLVLSGRNVSNLQELRNFKSLKELCVFSKNRTLPKEISALKALEILALSDVKMKDTTLIQSLSNLRKLSLFNCYLTKFNGLDSLKNLESLKLSSHQNPFFREVGSFPTDTTLFLTQPMNEKRDFQNGWIGEFPVFLEDPDRAYFLPEKQKKERRLFNE